jgi:NADPH-dependent curcumin reductase CurA
MQPISGFGVSKVILSNHPEFRPDDIVSGMTTWESYSVIKGGSGLRKITDNDLPLSYYVGVLGNSPDKNLQKNEESATKHSVINALASDLRIY